VPLDIKDHRFGPDYFRQFDLVMNALDNLRIFLSLSLFSFFLSVWCVSFGKLRSCASAREPPLPRDGRAAHREWYRRLLGTGLRAHKGSSSNPFEVVDDIHGRCKREKKRSTRLMTIPVGQDRVLRVPTETDPKDVRHFFLFSPLSLSFFVF
jgi:hypothetical protein